MKALQKPGWKRLLRWLPAALPAAGVLVAACLPLRPVVQQSLICIVLIWFQVVLMLGFIG